MKVRYEDSCTYAATQVIKSLEGEVILRSDLKGIDNERQITRAIHYLIEQSKITKIGHAIYAKLHYSKLTGKYYLKNGFMLTAREAFNRLGIAWQAGSTESNYSNSVSSQIPVNPKTKLYKRVRRTLSYKGMVVNAG